MPAAKRNKLERERDIARMEHLYCRGWTQQAIANELGVSRQQIQYDLQKLIKRWRDASIRDFDRAREIELQKINELERTYWEAWSESRHKRETTTAEKITSGKRVTERAKKHVIAQVGEVEYLRGIERCIDARCRLLGLYVQAQDPAKMETGMRLEDILTAGRGGFPRSAPPEYYVESTGEHPAAVPAAPAPRLTWEKTQ